jgi:hypothetical protein
MALFVGLDVSLRTTSICVVEANGSVVWEGKAESEPALLIKALIGWRGEIALIGIEACPLSEWLYGALVESDFRTMRIETRHAQRFLSSRPNKTDRSDARGIAEMMRLGHFRLVHVKSKASQLLRTTLIARRKFADHMAAIEATNSWAVEGAWPQARCCASMHVRRQSGDVTRRRARAAIGDRALARGAEHDEEAKGLARPTAWTDRAER